MKAIQIQNLSKTYKTNKIEKKAVKNISFDVNQGELFAFLGVNGAGKTTTIKMLSCLIKPTSGDAKLMEHSIQKESFEVKKIISVSPQETAVAPNLTVKENLKLMCGIYGWPNTIAEKKTNDTIKEFSLTEIQNSRAKTLSGGWQRRLSIAMSLITEPKILFLDEPTLGLDVLARRDLWHIIEKLKGKVTVILTTHYLEEAEALCDRIAIMSQGSLIALGTAEELKAKSGKNNFEDAFIALCQGENINED